MDYPSRPADLSPPQRARERHMDFRRSRLSQTFRTMLDTPAYGIYYEETGRSVIALRPHETVHDIISTCSHEVLHHCLAWIRNDEDIDEEQEHNIIRALVWAPETLL